MSKNARLGSDPLSWIKDSRVSKKNNLNKPKINNNSEPDKSLKTPRAGDSDVCFYKKNTKKEIKPPVSASPELSHNDLADQSQVIASECNNAILKCRQQNGKFLTCFLAGEEYGIEILKVQEIIGLQPITRIPKTPKFLKGVINLRGRVIPVIDLRGKFDMPSVEHTNKTCIIVVNSQGITRGVMVDEVSEVINMTDMDIEDIPSFGTSVRIDYLLGIGKNGINVKLLLDIDKILFNKEMDQVEA